MNTTRSQLVFFWDISRRIPLCGRTNIVHDVTREIFCLRFVKTAPLIFMDAQLCGGSHSQTGSVLEYFCNFVLINHCEGKDL